MSTIVDQLRDRAYATKAGDSLCEEAARLIEGLEWRSKVHASLIARLSAEVERLRDGAAEGRETVCPHVRGTVTQHCSLNTTLGDEEREAVKHMIHLIETRHEDYGKEAHVLRSLLERLPT